MFTGLAVGCALFIFWALVSGIFSKGTKGVDSMPLEERRIGMSSVYEASVSDAMLWMAEPNVLIVLGFYSLDKPSCETISSHLDTMAERYAEKVAVLQLNVGAREVVILGEHKITQTPTLKFFLNGVDVETLVGVQGETEIDDVFKKYTDTIQGEFVLLTDELPGLSRESSSKSTMSREKKGYLPPSMRRIKAPESSLGIAPN